MVEAHPGVCSELGVPHAERRPTRRRGRGGLGQQLHARAEGGGRQRGGERFGETAATPKRAVGAQEATAARPGVGGGERRPSSPPHVVAGLVIEGGHVGSGTQTVGVAAHKNYWHKAAAFGLW